MTNETSTIVSRGRGAMARRRDRASRAPLRVVAAFVTVTAILALSIQVGGEVTQLREEIQVLRRQCDELEARRALLSVRWNAETSRQVVMRRAREELDLVCPDDPGLLLVASPPRGDDAERALVALRPASGGVATAVAGERP